MEFISTKEELQKGVQLVERIVSTRSTLPIIGNILIEAVKDRLKISANNLELGVEVVIPAQIKSEGSILVPAKTLAGIVSKLPAKEIAFKLSEKGQVRLSYQDSHFNLHALPAEEFPALPKIKEGKSFSLPAQLLSDMIGQTIFSASTSEDKYVLTGVLFETTASQLRLVSTDGYRLAKYSAKADLKKAGELKAIIPARVLSELQKVLLGEGEVQIQLSSDQAAFRYGGVYFISRLISGSFPDYEQVIPKSSPIKLKAETTELLQAAERAAVIAAGSANIVRFDLKGSKLFLLSSSPDIGSIEEIVEVENKGKDKVQIAFNIRLIIDVLRVIEDKKVSLDLSEPLSPGVIRPDSEQDYSYVVMPIRTQEAA